jgi:hypothetical protein
MNLLVCILFWWFIHTIIPSTPPPVRRETPGPCFTDRCMEWNGFFGNPLVWFFAAVFFGAVAVRLIKMANV